MTNKYKNCGPSPASCYHAAGDPCKFTDKPKKRGRPSKPKAPVSLKMVISRTFSEGAKINIGNYQSRDFFASASRSLEVPWPCSIEQQEQISAQLFQMVHEEVKTALKVETDDASGTKPMENRYVKIDDAPSVPDAFSKEHARMYPGKKYVPREDDDDMDLI